MGLSLHICHVLTADQIYCGLTFYFLVCITENRAPEIVSKIAYLLLLYLKVVRLKLTLLVKMHYFLLHDLHLFCFLKEQSFCYSQLKPVFNLIHKSWGDRLSLNPNPHMRVIISRGVSGYVVGVTSFSWSEFWVWLPILTNRIRHFQTLQYHHSIFIYFCLFSFCHFLLMTQMAWSLYSLSTSAICGFWLLCFCELYSIGYTMV